MPFSRAVGRSHRAPAAPYQIVASGPVGSGEISFDTSSSMMSTSPQLAITGPPTFTGPPIGYPASSSAQPAIHNPAPISIQSPSVPSVPVVMQDYILSLPNVPVGSPPGLSVPLVPVNQGGAGSSPGPSHSVPFVPDAQDLRADPNFRHLIQQNIHQTAVDASHDINMASHVEYHEQPNQQVNVLCTSRGFPLIR